jgi:ElaB/YqjD/DUF883 family membrane-anchored ribosome-binding protein
MAQTREAITEKVAALETQVLDTFQTAANTVSGTVDAVKEAVTSAPAAVSETVRQTMDAVKQTLDSVSVSSCVRGHPWSAVGTSVAAGFLAGWILGSSARPRSISATAADAPRPPIETAQSHPVPTLFGRLAATVGDRAQQLAQESLKSALDSLNRTIGSHVPQLVDSAVHRWFTQMERKVGNSNGAVRA